MIAIVLMHCKFLQARELGSMVVVRRRVMNVPVSS